MPKLNILDWGLISYNEAQLQQEEILKGIVDQKLLNRNAIQSIQNKLPESYLIFCQHSPVYTLGNSGSKENLLLDEIIPFYFMDRLFYHAATPITI